MVIARWHVTVQSKKQQTMSDNNRALLRPLERFVTTDPLMQNAATQHEGNVISWTDSADDSPHPSSWTFCWRCRTARCTRWFARCTPRSCGGASQAQGWCLRSCLCSAASGTGRWRWTSSAWMCVNLRKNKCKCLLQRSGKRPHIETRPEVPLEAWVIWKPEVGWENVNAECEWCEIPTTGLWMINKIVLQAWSRGQTATQSYLSRN